MIVLLPALYSTKHLFMLFATVLLLVMSTAARSAGEQPAPPFWRVTNAANETYILGSMHLGTPKMYPLPAPIRDALSRAKIIALEIDSTAITPRQLARMQALGTYPQGESLRAHAGPQRWTEMTALCHRLAVDCDRLVKRRPWLAALELVLAAVAKAGFNALHGIEVHILLNKPAATRIIELESFEAQLAVLSGFVNEEALAYLMETIESFDDIDTVLRELADAWLYGRDEDLDRLINQEMRGSKVKDLYKKMIVDRNHTMADGIEELLRQQEPTLVVVGAGHVVGVDSIPNVLKARGWQLERVRP